MDATKTCRRCGETKPRETHFYRHHKMRDGHLNICTSCKRRESRDRRHANIEQERERDRARGFRSTPRIKQRARRVVNLALERGDMVRKPCEVCGSTDTEAHHDDYARALEVRWLCRPHHAKLHRTYA